MVHTNIRSATKDDLKLLASLRFGAIKAVNAKFYSKVELDKWAGSPEDGEMRLENNLADVRIVIQVGDQIAGYGELVTQNNLLGACYVHPEHGGRGVGRRIVAELERLASARGLDHLLFESSKNAEGFYLKLGFERALNKIDPKEVRIMMRKDLN